MNTASSHLQSVESSLAHAEDGHASGLPEPMVQNGKAVVFAHVVDAQVGEGGSERSQAVESPVASQAKGHGTAVLADAADAEAVVANSRSSNQLLRAPTGRLRMDGVMGTLLVGAFMVGFLACLHRVANSSEL